MSITVDALINTSAINAVTIFAREPIELERYWLINYVTSSRTLRAYNCDNRNFIDMCDCI